MNKVKLAEIYAEAAHYGQKRKFGDRPYTYHLREINNYLIDRGYTDVDLLAAAWLHDTVEDCDVSLDEIARLFGYNVVKLVDSVSHPKVIARSRPYRWKYYLEHYSKADKWGRLLKLVDRRCNLKEFVDFWDELPPTEKTFVQTVYFNETLDLLRIFNYYPTDDLSKEIGDLLDKTQELQ